MGTECSKMVASVQKKNKTDEAKPHPQSKPTVEVKQSDNEGLGKSVKETPAAHHVVDNKIPHNLEAILKEADSPLDKSELLAKLPDGIFLNQKKKKYWIDKNSNNCFMVYPKDLYICWVNDSRYFKWYTLKETSDESIEVAELLNVCWLEINGKIDSAMLTPGTTYEVAFVIMVKENSRGLQYPIKLTLSLPDGSAQEHKVILLKKATEQWIKIPAGQFKTPPLQNDGNYIGFTFTELDSGQWKTGIVFKGVRIQPIKERLSVV